MYNEDFNTCQKIPKGSKRFQKDPKGSKNVQQKFVDFDSTLPKSTKKVVTINKKMLKQSMQYANKQKNVNF